MSFNPINTMSSDFRVCNCDVSSNEAVAALFALAVIHQPIIRRFGFMTPLHIIYTD